MEYSVVLSLVMLTGIAQGRVLSPLPYDIVRDPPPTVDTQDNGLLPYDIVRDPPPTVDTQDNGLNEIMRNIRWDEANDGLYQGDMVLTDEQKRAMVERKAIKDERYRWPKSADGTVNIDFGFGDTIVNRSGVALAMSRWQQATCVKFNEITADVAKPHIIIVNDIDCSSSVGRVYYDNGQELSLSPTCYNGGDATVVHELGHALGLHHEQSRSDRDDYLYVIIGNVESGMEFNFNVEDTNNYGLPYDYSSIMQYTATAFSKNGLNTIVAKDPLAQTLISDNEILSFMDKKIVNLMYNCTGTWLAKCNLVATPCKNQGYTKSDCSCDCPAGTSGANCETLNQPYIDALVNVKSPGSQRITTEGTVTSPGYPVPVKTSTSRVQSIVAPECHKVKLTFIAFDMQGLSTFHSSNGSTYQKCWYMILEIRLDDPPVTGTKYCGANITATQTFESVGRPMVLTFSAAAGNPDNTNTGYKATVQFVPVTTGKCLSASKVGTAIILPTSSSRLTFQASPLSPTGSFFLPVEVVNSGCHKLIELVAGSTGPLSIPANYPPRTVCEWWLRAPAGRKVQVSFSKFSIGDSSCLRDSVIISRTGNNRYDTGSTRYCGGNEASPGTVVSIDNALNILVNGQFGNYQGLQATFTVV